MNRNWPHSYQKTELSRTIWFVSDCSRSHNFSVEFRLCRFTRTTRARDWIVLEKNRTTLWDPWRFSLWIHIVSTTLQDKLQSTERIFAFLNGVYVMYLSERIQTMTTFLTLELYVSCDTVLERSLRTSKKWPQELGSLTQKQCFEFHVARFSKCFEFQW